MTQEPRYLSEQEAIAFAGITESTLHRYVDAGFLTPVLVNDVALFKEEELIQVFELSSKQAAANRKEMQKKAFSEAERLMSEKDRLMADKDIQIRDLKDQRAWLQARVERLEIDLKSNSKKTVIEKQESLNEDTSSLQPAPVAHLPAPHLPVRGDKEIIEEDKKGGTLRKVLHYFGFIKNSLSAQEPASVKTSYTQTSGHARENSPPTTQPHDIHRVKKNPFPSAQDRNVENNDKVCADDEKAHANGSPPSVPLEAVTPKSRTRGNRPFRESKQALAELLGDEGFLDRDFAPKGTEDKKSK
jgi:hypothetical protein